MDFREIAKHAVSINKQLKRESHNITKLRNLPPPPPAVNATLTGKIVPVVSNRKVGVAQSYTTIETANSRGEVYKITVPSSYIEHIPAIWLWDDIKYRVAELIAEGIPMKRIPEQGHGFPSSMLIYAWMKHPEFRAHVDNLIMNTGHADKQGRIAGLKAVTEKLFNLIMDHVSKEDVTEKSVGSILTAYHNMSKQLGQEKDEFSESVNIKSESTVTIDGQVNVAHVNVTEVLNRASQDERVQLEQELKAIGDNLVKNMLGGTVAND